MLTALARRAGDVRRRRDAGITLTELLVTMGLMSVVGALALGVLVNATATTDRATEGSLAGSESRTALLSWTQVLQTAVAPDPTQPASTTVRRLVVTPTSLEVDTQLGNKPSCSDTCTTGAVTRARLELRTTTVDGRSTGQLVQTLTTAESSSSVVLVSRGASAGPCLFTLVGRGLPSSCGSATVPLRDPLDVRRVDIAFTLTPSSGPAQSYRTSVTLPRSST